MNICLTMHCKKNNKNKKILNLGWVALVAIAMQKPSGKYVGYPCRA